MCVEKVCCDHCGVFVQCEESFEFVIGGVIE